MNRNLATVVGAVIGLAGGFWPRAAQAGIDACGDIHVEANARCEVVVGTTCEAMCKPVALRAACAAQLAASCEGGCDELPSASCSGECSAGCEVECADFEPGEFDCEASCEADCSGRCDASCSAESDRASCAARCQGSCGASCQGSCEVTPPKADCDAACEASCRGSCTVDPNLDCQLDCQAMGQAECEVDVQGGCEIDCDSQEGALFCDGQYIDHGHKLEECVDALQALLDIEVSGYSRGSSSCDNGSCMAEGEAGGELSSKCSVATPGTRAGGAAGLALLGLAWAAASVRRRRPSL